MRQYVHTKQPIDVEKVHQGVVESMPPINECEINFYSFCCELRECDLGFLLAKIYQESETSFAKIAKPYSLPLGGLSRIDQNVKNYPSPMRVLACEDRHPVTETKDATYSTDAVERSFLPRSAPRVEVCRLQTGIE